jgi:NTE family protein
VLAVYLNSHWLNLNGPRHVFDVVGQCFSLAQAKNCAGWQAAADVIVQPDVRGYSYDGFEHAAELIASGEQAARDALPHLLKWIEQAEFPSALPKTAKQISPATTPA